MTAPLVMDFIPEPWEDYPSTLTPIVARRLARYENQIAALTAGMGAVLRAGTTGKLLLAAPTPEVARGVIGAASAEDLRNRVVNIGDVSGLYWSPSTPTAASLIAGGIPSGTLIVSPSGLAFLLGTSLIPIGLTSGSSLVASVGASGGGTLTAVARVGARGYVAQALGQGFLSVTGVLGGAAAGSAAVLTGGGTLAVTSSVAAYTGRYNDTYTDTYGS